MGHSTQYKNNNLLCIANINAFWKQRGKEANARLAKIKHITSPNLPNTYFYYIISDVDYRWQP